MTAIRETVVGRRAVSVLTRMATPAVATVIGAISLLSVAQPQVLMRASYPLYEVGMALGGHRQEDQHWIQTLQSIAAHFGVVAEVEVERVCVDRRREWSRCGNVWQNAGIRSGLHMIGTPFRAIRPRKREHD